MTTANGLSFDLGEKKIDGCSWNSAFEGSSNQIENQEINSKSPKAKTEPQSGNRGASGESRKSPATGNSHENEQNSNEKGSIEMIENPQIHQIDPWAVKTIKERLENFTSFPTKATTDNQIPQIADLSKLDNISDAKKPNSQLFLTHKPINKNCK